MQPEIDAEAVAFRDVVNKAAAHHTDEAAAVISSRQQKTIIEGRSPRVMSSGHLVFARAGRLWSVPFDSKALAVTGVPVAVTEDLGDFANNGDYDVAENGTLIYTRMDPRRTLVWVDRKGEEQPLQFPPKRYLYPRISPEGTRVVLDVRNESNEGDIWMVDLNRETLTRLVDFENDRHPIWSNDSKRIFFAVTGSGNSAFRLQSIASDGTGTAHVVMKHAILQYPLSFSPDGGQLLTRSMGGTNFDVNVVSMDSRQLSPLLAAEAYETNAQFSPDGRWIAYESFQEGVSRREVYVRPFPDVNRTRWQISTAGGSQPLWSRSGRELFYLDLEGRLTVVNVDAKASFSASSPTRMFDRAYLFQSLVGPARTYDISPDGSRFLMIKEVDTTSVVVVLNWAAMLSPR